MLRNPLGFDHMHVNNFFIYIFLKGKFFLRNVSEKTGYFNIGSVSYSVKIQPNIMQNW